MNYSLLLFSVVILLCVFSSRISMHFAVPMLVIFIGLGMLFGSDGLLKIAFDDYELAEQICSVALVFIIFYGGFSTNLKTAKPVLGKAILLSSLGVVLAAGSVFVFCYFILHMDLVEAFLLGAMISSTDAASVFSILRTNKLSLKDNTAPLLEVESGSNDPFSYMLTIVGLTMLEGSFKLNSMMGMLVAQIGMGLLVGFLGSYLAKRIMEYLKNIPSGMDVAFIFGVSLLLFSAAQLIGGNGYLAVYVGGIVLGNSRIPNKVSLVHFFDAFTSLSQMAIFFTLGLLSFPSRIGSVLPVAIAVFLFLSLIGRPLSMVILLRGLKVSWNQIAVISFCGLRGAASIVFAIMALSTGYPFTQDLFHIVFCISLLSVSFQGALLPWFARKLSMVENSDNIFKTFNDYVELDLQFIQARVNEENHWCNMTIEDLQLSKDIRILAVLRSGKVIIPKGDTMLLEDDIAVISGKSFKNSDILKLHEHEVYEGHKWSGKRIKEIAWGNHNVVLVVKGEKSVIPNGDTLIEVGDLVVVSES